MLTYYLMWNNKLIETNTKHSQLLVFLNNIIQSYNKNSNTTS